MGVPQRHWTDASINAEKRFSILIVLVILKIEGSYDGVKLKVIM